MNAALVLTVIGPDRPGLVERLSETVALHGANWLEIAVSDTGIGIPAAEQEGERFDEALARMLFRSFVWFPYPIKSIKSLASTLCLQRMQPHR